MGLDMTLTKKIFIGAQYKYRNIEANIKITENGREIKIDPSRVSYIEECTIQWRKANQIHKWFVDNVQDGEDDCGIYDVSREHLLELVAVCEKVISSSELIDGEIVVSYSYEKKRGDKFVKIPNLEKGKVIKDSSVAEKLLPSQSGFFFGGTEYDSYYLEDLTFTVEEVKKILAEWSQDAEFVYSSSW